MTSTPSAVILSLSIANWKARRTARGQYGQVGVEKTWTWTGRSISLRAARVSLAEPAVAAGDVEDRVHERAELVPGGQAVHADAVVLLRPQDGDGGDARDAQRLHLLLVEHEVVGLGGDAGIEGGQLLDQAPAPARTRGRPGPGRTRPGAPGSRAAANSSLSWLATSSVIRGIAIWSSIAVRAERSPRTSISTPARASDPGREPGPGPHAAARSK